MILKIPNEITDLLTPNEIEILVNNYGYSMHWGPGYLLYKVIPDCCYECHNFNVKEAEKACLKCGQIRQCMNG